MDGLRTISLSLGLYLEAVSLEYKEPTREGASLALASGSPR